MFGFFKILGIVGAAFLVLALLLIAVLEILDVYGDILICRRGRK